MEPITVLLVDDSLTFLHVASEFLHDSSGGTVRVVGTADSAARGIELASAERPQVILVDMKMPDVTGLDAIPQLRAAAPDSRIIALTLMDTNGYRQAALRAGADEFIPKDKMHERLLPAIQRIVGDGFRQMPAAAERAPGSS